MFNNISVLSFEDFKAEFILNFVKDDRYKYLVNGLGITIKVTFFALIIGLVIGVIIALVRSTYDKTHTTVYSSFVQFVFQKLLSFGNLLCNLYLTVIRGTPSTVQLLIIYFVIFGSVHIDKSFAAICAFGINSGAYMAEIIRGGIMSVDNGQTEAGRSLGFGYTSTMRYIVLPQALRNALPALGNEVIVLLKETSISGFIALEDLTKGADIIRSRTYSALMPLLAVALIYLCIVILLTNIFRYIEHRTHSHER